MEKKLTIALLITVGIAAILILYHRFSGSGQEVREIAVTIEGNIKKPGTYYVPYGTTKFEILRVAGITQSSDLKNLDIYAEASEGENMNVGTLDKDVSLKSVSTTAKPCVVNFFVGDVSISGKYGSRKPDRDVPVFEGDKIKCGAQGTVELRLGDESLIDLKSQAELSVLSLYTADQTGLMNVNLQVDKGKIWAYIKPQPQNVRFVFSTSRMVVEIKGTEVEIETDSSMSALYLTKGTVSVGKVGSDRRITLAEGQKVIVDNNPDNELVAGNITDEEKGTDSELKAFREEKDKSLSGNTVERILFLALPDFYILSDMDASKSQITVSRIFPTSDVSEYIDGVDELGKVYLYGGIRLTTSIVERMTKKKLEHYGVMSRENVIEIINKLGGVMIDVDYISAGIMEVKPGMQKLDGYKAIKYVAAGIRSGSQSAGSADEIISRQNKLLRAVYEASLANKIGFSTILFTQILKNMETNMDANYAAEYYKVFKSKTDWKINFGTLAL